MENMKRVVRVIPAGQWPDSRAEQRAYWLGQPPSVRVRAGREFQRKMYWWMNGRELPRHMKKVVRPFHHDQ